MLIDARTFDPMKLAEYTVLNEPTETEATLRTEMKARPISVKSSAVGIFEYLDEFSNFVFLYTFISTKIALSLTCAQT